MSRRFEPSGFPHRIGAKGREPDVSHVVFLTALSATGCQLFGGGEKNQRTTFNSIVMLVFLQERTLKEDIYTLMGLHTVVSVYLSFVVECK